MANLDGTDDVFDSREVIERIAELQERFSPESADAEDALDEDEQIEYEALVSLRDEAEGCVSDWQYGETFISEDYFTEYAMETLKDIGYLPADLPEWIIIDEDSTAENVKEDYREFTFRGTTYYAR